MSEEFSRAEPCGCTSFKVTNRPPSENFWVMEASCPKHLQVFVDLDAKREKHIREYHLDEDEPQM